MANGQQPQVPHFELPGTEYFALAPNRTIAIHGRRHFFFQSAATSIPSANLAAVTASGQIETGFPPGAAIYLHDMAIVVLPADGSLKLQIVAIRMGLAISALTNIAYELGNPLLTLVTPGPGGMNALTDRDKLVTQRDIQAFDTAQPNPPLPLFVTAALTFNNLDGAANHSITVSVKGTYTRLDGFTE